MKQNLLNLDAPNTRTLLDKSVWDGLKREEIWTLSSVSMVALAPVWYEEIRAELKPRGKPKTDPVKRLGWGAAKATSLRTYALPAAWQIAECELTQQCVQTMYGLPVDMPYIFDQESRGIILDQQAELYDLQRWTSQREARPEEVEAARLWREHLAKCRPPSSARSSNTPEEPESIRKVYKDSWRQASYAAGDVRGLAQLLTLLGFSQEKALRLAKRWFSYQDLMVERDAPYTFRSIALELFIRKVSEHWPCRGANRADFTYIHYLPFCDIFATNDTIQFNYAEVWRTLGQLIVDTTTLRDELAEIERLRATSERSVMDLPPPESTGIFATAMDQIRPDWRSQAVKTATSSSTGAPGESKLVEKLTKRIDRAIARGTRVPARYGTKGESKPDG